MEKPAGSTALRTAARPVLGNTALTRRTGLSLPADFTLADWKRFGKHLFLISDSSSWWLGDWLIFGQDMYPGRYRQAMEETGLDYKTLRNYAWIARRYPAPTRHPKLSVQHHAEVASLEPAERAAWLDRAAREGWSRNALRLHLRKAASLAAGSAESRTEEIRLQLRTTADREAVWADAAERSGRDLAEWIILSLDRAAGQVAAGREEHA
ncbi:LmbU family transcriptional regulator [Streptomyces sp. NPDC097619]|uniref:LmbU family transcriptional regulator n=1 Tax=Streptomyces sp. NPDC097619 TaxID=3157228 RepID=UPI003331E272